MPGLNPKITYFPFTLGDCLNCKVTQGRWRRTRSSPSMVAEGRVGKKCQAWIPSPSYSYCQQLRRKNRSHLPFSLLPIKLPPPTSPRFQGLPHPRGQNRFPSTQGQLRVRGSAPPWLPPRHDQISPLPSLALPGIPPLVTFRCGNSGQHT